MDTWVDEAETSPTQPHTLSITKETAEPAASTSNKKGKPAAATVVTKPQPQKPVVATCAEAAEDSPASGGSEDAAAADENEEGTPSAQPHTSSTIKVTVELQAAAGSINGRQGAAAGSSG
jgi:hypothetical protein